MHKHENNGVAKQATRPAKSRRTTLASSACELTWDGENGEEVIRQFHLHYEADRVTLIRTISWAVANGIEVTISPGHTA